MKVVGIGDLLIPQEYIMEGFKNFKEAGHEVETIQWKLESYEELQNINLEVELHGSEAVEPPQEVLDAIHDADIVITQFCPMTRKAIESCANLKVIGVLRGGIENINLEACTENGILVYNTPGRNANAVADFTVGMLLCECRNIAKAHRNLKEGKWVRDYDNAASVPDLPYKTAGIVGFGNIGRKVAQRLNGFEMNILAYDPFAKNVPDYVTLVDLPELMSKSDFVLVHARAMKETEHMINRELIAMMKPTAYLINTARSSLVDEQALYEALRDKKIIGAALDVFDVEPPTADYPIVALPNVTVTPHLAGGSVDASTNSPILLSKEMIHITEKKSSPFVVNKEIFDQVVAGLE